MEEYDLYDKNRQKLNEKLERKYQPPKGKCRVVIHVCLFNSKGQMLIQQRSQTKKVNPNKWDVSVGGCVIAGEDARTAASRELFEELSIKHDFSNEIPHLTINFDGGFDDYFTFIQDVPLKDVKFGDREVQKVKWASEKQILKMIKDGTFLPYHPTLISALFGMHTFPPSNFTKLPF